MIPILLFNNGDALICQCNHTKYTNKSLFKQHIRSKGHSDFLNNYEEYEKPNMDDVKETLELRRSLLLQYNINAGLRKNIITLNEEHITLEKQKKPWNSILKNKQ